MPSSTEEGNGDEASRRKNRSLLFSGLKGLFTSRSNRDSVIVVDSSSTPLDTSPPAQTVTTTSGSTGGPNSESLESSRIPALHRVISGEDPKPSMANVVEGSTRKSFQMSPHRYAHSASRISATSSSNNIKTSSIGNGNTVMESSPPQQNRSSTTPNMSTNNHNNAPPDPPPLLGALNNVSPKASDQLAVYPKAALAHGTHGESYSSSLSINGQSNRMIQRMDEGLTTTPTPTATNTTDGDRQRSSKDFILPTTLAHANAPGGTPLPVSGELALPMGQNSGGNVAEINAGIRGNNDNKHGVVGEASLVRARPEDERRNSKSRFGGMAGSPHCSGVHFSVPAEEPFVTRQVSTEMEAEHTLPSTIGESIQNEKKVSFHLSLKTGLIIKASFIYFIGFLFCVGTMAAVIIIATKERKVFLNYSTSQEVEFVAATMNPSFIMIALSCGCVLIYLITGVFLYTYTSRYAGMAQHKIEEYTHFFEMVQAWNLDLAPFYVNDTKGVSSEQLAALQNRYLNGDAGSGNYVSSPLSDGNTGNALMHNLNAKETFTLLVYSKKLAEQKAELSLSIANIRLRHYKNRIVSLQMLLSSNPNNSFLLLASSLGNSFQPLHQFYQLKQQQQQQLLRGGYDADGAANGVFDYRMQSQNLSNPLLSSAANNMGSPPAGSSFRARGNADIDQKGPPPLGSNPGDAGLVVKASGRGTVDRNGKQGDIENDHNVVAEDDVEITSLNNTLTNLEQLPGGTAERGKPRKETKESASSQPFAVSPSSSRSKSAAQNARYSTFSVGSSKSGTNRGVLSQALNPPSPTSSLTYGRADSVNHGILPSNCGGLLNDDLDMLLLDDCPSGRGQSLGGGRGGRGDNVGTSPRAMQHSRPPRPNSVMANPNHFGERGVVSASIDGAPLAEERNVNATRTNQTDRNSEATNGDVVSIAPTNATAIGANCTALTHDGFVVPDKNAILRAYRKDQPIVLRDVTVLVASFSGFFDAMYFDQQYARRISNLFLGIITEWAHYYGGMTIVSRPDLMYIVWNTSALPRTGNDHKEISLACGRQLSESLGNAKLRRGVDGTVENNALDGFFPVLVLYSGKLLTGTMGDTQLQRRLVVFGRELQVVNSVIPLLHVLRQTATATTGVRWMPKDAHESLSIGLSITFVWMGKGDNDPPPTKQYIPVDRIIDVQRARERERKKYGADGNTARFNEKNHKYINNVSNEDIYVLYGLWPERQLSPKQMESMMLMNPAFQAFVKGDHEKAFQLYCKALEIYPQNPLAPRLKILAQHFALERGPGYSRALPHWPIFGVETEDDSVLEKKLSEIEMEEENEKVSSDLSVDTPLLDGKNDNKGKKSGVASQFEAYQFPTSASGGGGTGSANSPITSSPPGLPVIMVSSSSFSTVNAERQSRIKSYHFPDDSPFALRPLQNNESQQNRSPESETERVPAVNQQKPVTSIIAANSKFGGSLLSPGCESSRNHRGSLAQLTPAIVSPSMLEDDVEGPRTAKTRDTQNDFASPMSDVTDIYPRTLGSSVATALDRESDFSRSPSAAPTFGGPNTAEGSHTLSPKPNMSSRGSGSPDGEKAHGSNNTGFLRDEELLNPLKEEKQGEKEKDGGQTSSSSFLSLRPSEDGQLTPGRKKSRVKNTTIVPSTLASGSEFTGQSGGSDNKGQVQPYNELEEQQRRRSNLLRQKSIFCINPLSMPASPRRGNSLVQEDDFASGFGPKKNTLSTDITDKQGLMFRISQRVLGRGASGEVRLGLSHMGGLVAIKVVELVIASKSGDETPKENTPSEGGLSERAKAIQRRRLKRKGIPTQANVKETVNSLAAEIEMLSRLRHSCIVGYIGAVIEESRLMLIMEYASGGSLQKVLDLFTDLSHVQGTGYLKDVLHGLVYLHSQQIVHRDVKPENVLVTSSGLCKLIDFGISKQMSVATRALQVDGTPFYMAPEAFTGNVTAKSDIWSFGIMLAVVYTRKLPWPPNTNPMSISYQLSRNPNFTPELHGELTPEEMEVFVACTQRDPDKRPTAHSILQMSLFKPSKQMKSPGKNSGVIAAQTALQSPSALAATPPSVTGRMNASNTGGSSNVRDSQVLTGGGTFSSVANASNSQAKKKRGVPLPYLLSTGGPFSTTTNTTNTTNNSNSTLMLTNGEDASLNNLLSQTQKNVMSSCSSYGDHFSSNVVEASAVSTQPIDFSSQQFSISPRVGSFRHRRQPTQSTAMKSLDRQEESYSVTAEAQQLNKPTRHSER